MAHDRLMLVLTAEMRRVEIGRAGTLAQEASVCSPSVRASSDRAETSRELVRTPVFAVEEVDDGCSRLRDGGSGASR